MKKGVNTVKLRKAILLTLTVAAAVLLFVLLAIPSGAETYSGNCGAEGAG